jgi:hypothetical protein
MAQLLPIIPKYAFGFAIALKLNEVDRLLVDRPELRKFHKDPYEACFHWMLTSVLRDLHSRVSTPRPIAVIHEINDYEERARKAFEYVRRTEEHGKTLISLTFAGKDEFVPLQAADTLAYEAARRVLYQDGPER